MYWGPLTLAEVTSARKLLHATPDLWTLSSYAMNESDQPTFDIAEMVATAMAAQNPMLDLRAQVVDRITAGVPRAALQEALEAESASLRGRGLEAEEDVVLEVLDCLVGWVSSHWKI